VPAGQPVLGALGRSRHASMIKMPKSATETAFCTKKREDAKGQSRDSLWQLAGVEADAFGAGRGSSNGRRVRLRTVMFLRLALYERRAHPSGRAVCLLGLRQCRFRAAVGALVLVLCAVGALSVYAGVVLAAVIIAVLLPGAVGAAQALAQSATRSAAWAPAGPHVYVHSVASTLPGAGAELLRALTREADSKGWSLVLDARNEKLARYYRNLGFVPGGPPAKMPDAGSHMRMWRPPDRLEVGGCDRGMLRYRRRTERRVSS
jgi:hypothetical protein